MVLQLLSLLLFAATALGDAHGDEKLVKDVIDASKAQKNKTEVISPVVSDVVKEAPSATLQNGDGDIATTGACEGDIDALCTDVPPGEGRVATCIATRMRNENRGNVSGRKVAQACREELQQFYSDRAKNVNLNLGLAAACKEDVSKHCKDLGDKGEGAVLACLRRNRAKLTNACQVRVLKAMVSAAMDFRADPQLAKKCSDDAKRECADVPYGQGRVQGCLRDNLTRLSSDCALELFRQEVENSDDIRLSLRLYKACQTDQQRFCEDIPYGASRIKDCLEDHRLEPKFSSECRVEIENMMKHRAGNYQLDPELTRACDADIKKTCIFQGHGDTGDGGDNVHSGRVTMCLVDHHEELQVQECRDAVHRVMKRASQDMRFDAKLAEACKEDKEQHCKDVDPGSARVIRCLQDSRAVLSDSCRPILFDYERTLAEDIDFQYPMQQACAREIKAMCGKVKSGYARVIRCLHKQVDSDDMGSECRKEVRRNMHHMAQDYRLNVRLKRACSADVEILCSRICSESEVCEGQVLNCLQKNMEKISSSDCKDEVFYFVKMEVSDFQNDVILAEACKKDVESLCQVEPGDGRMLECLHQNRKTLTPKCRTEEMRISQMQARDVRLRPKLMKLCAEEMVLFCDKTSPGGGRMFNCLLEHVSKPMFGGPCKVEVLKREDLAKEDYRMDGGVADACEDDIEEHCKQAKNGSRGHAAVLTCLVDRMSHPSIELGETCEKQVSRAVRMAFWDYKEGTHLTMPCDDDVTALCPNPTRKQGVFSIGVVARCLSKQLASSLPLKDGCRKLVSIAAPKDIRLYLQETMNADGSLRGGYLQSAMDTAASAKSFITLNGWVAVLSVMATIFVVVGGALFVLRRYTGMDKPYTRFVPQSDTDMEGPDAQ